MQFRSLILSIGSDLYAGNGFRITGLSTDASAQDITKINHQLSMTEKLGVKSANSTGPMPAATAPSLHDIQEALARLKDPERRLVDDFFWLWPLPRFSWANDPAIQALISGQIKKALDYWGKASADPSLRSTAIHNVAVVHHLVALERTRNPRYCEGAFPVEPFSVSLWTQALLYWNQFFSTCSPVQCIAERIAQIDDIRLSANMADEFSESAQLAIGVASCAIAYKSAEKGDWQRANFHAGILKKHFPAPLLDEAMRLTVKPARERLNGLCLKAEADSQKEPSKNVAIVQKLIGDTKNDLLILISFLNPGDSFRDGAGDQVARSAIHVLSRYRANAMDWAACKFLLATVTLFAQTETVREEAKQNLATAALNEIGQVQQLYISNSEAICKGTTARARTIRLHAFDTRDALLSNVDAYKAAAMPLLKWIEARFGSNSKTYEEATAIYCAGVRALAITLNNQAQAPDVALNLTVEALAICKDNDLHATLNADLLRLLKNADATKRRAEHPFTFSKPDQNFVDKHPAVASLLAVVGILGLFGLTTLCHHSSDSHSTQGLSSGSSNHSRTYRADPVPPGFVLDPPTSSSGLDLSALKASIENSNRILADLEKQVSLCNGQIDTEKRKLNVLKEDLDSLDDQRRHRLNIDTDYYNEIVDQYNSILVSYKALLSKKNALEKQHNTLLAYTHADIDKYNKAVRGY